MPENPNYKGMRVKLLHEIAFHDILCDLKQGTEVYTHQHSTKKKSTGSRWYSLGHSHIHDHRDSENRKIRNKFRVTIKMVNGSFLEDVPDPKPRKPTKRLTRPLCMPANLTLMGNDWVTMSGVYKENPASTDKKMQKWYVRSEFSKDPFMVSGLSIDWKTAVKPKK